jgi:hypothetical protein
MAVGLADNRSRAANSPYLVQSSAKVGVRYEQYR